MTYSVSYILNGGQSVLRMHEMLRFPSESQTCTQLNCYCVVDMSYLGPTASTTT